MKRYNVHVSVIVLAENAEDAERSVRLRGGLRVQEFVVCGSTEETSTAEEEQCPPTERDPSVGTAVDPEPFPDPEPPSYVPPKDPKRVIMKSRWRDLNSKGHGCECYRLAVCGDVLVWIEKHPDVIETKRGMVPQGIRASERKCSNLVEVPEGLIVVTITKNGNISYTAGRVQEKEGAPGYGAFYAEDGVDHVGVHKVEGSYRHVLQIDGERREFTSRS